MPNRRLAKSYVQIMLAFIVSSLCARAGAAASCVQSMTAWINTPIATQTAQFTATFAATPNQASIDGVVGFSSNAATGYTSLAAVVRFNSTGEIDVRNGPNYTADQSVPYAAGSTYQFQMMINPVTHTYSVHVTPPGGSQIALASNYSFRTEQANTSSLNSWGLYVDVGSESICNLTATAGPLITMEPANGTVAAGQTATFSVTATGNAPLSYQWQENGASIGGATSATYITAPTSSANNGAQFTVLVSNSSGSVTSSAATLTVTSPSSCVQSTAAWINTPIAAQTAPFTATFAATPNQADIDGVVGFSSNAATGYTSLAPIIRFNDTGTIDVRNGSSYTADQSVPYAAGSTYQFRMVINPATHIYSVYVTPPGGSQITLASNYSFRNDQANTSSLGNWGLYVDVGSESICNLSIATPSGPGFGSVPIITSATTASATVGNAFSYQITATNSPTSYAATGLPGGLSLNSSTGVISGTPTAAGTSSVTLSATNATGAGNATLTLSTSGTAQSSISPVSVVFGNINVGSNATQSVTLTNAGNTTLNITAVTTTGSGYTTGLKATSINPGANTTFTVTFAPTTGGSASGSILIASNAANSSATIALSGTGSLAQIAATPSSVAFGTVTEGDTNTQPITLKNSGNSILTLSGVSVTGAGFNQTGLSTSTTIAAGGSVTFNATFDPSSTSTVNGSITLTTNGTPSSLAISLSGTGQAATVLLGANPTSLAFGNVLDGSSSSMTSTITNSGTSIVTISSLTVTGAGFSVSGIANVTVLTPGQSMPLQVLFAPTSGGAVSGASVSISSNATGSPMKIGLSGTGTHSVVLTWEASPTSGATYNVYRGTSSGGEGTTPINSSPITGLTYTDTNVAPGASYYYYAVEAVDSGGSSAASSEAVANVPNP